MTLVLTTEVGQSRSVVELSTPAQNVARQIARTLDSTLVDNVSGVAGASVSAALDTLAGAIAAPMAANSVRANPTAAPAPGTDLSVSLGGVVGRAQTGDLVSLSGAQQSENLRFGPPLVDTTSTGTIVSYSPTGYVAGTTNYIRCSPAGNVIVRGMPIALGGILYFRVGRSSPNTFTFLHEDGAALANELFNCPGNENYVMGAGDACIIVQSEARNNIIAIGKASSPPLNADTDGNATTTSATFQQAQTLGAFNTGAPGTYRFDWYVEINVAVAGGTSQVRANLDGVVVGLSQQEFQIAATDFRSISGWCLRTLAAGAHTATLEFASDGVNTATVRRRRLTIART